MAARWRELPTRSSSRSLPCFCLRVSQACSVLWRTALRASSTAGVCSNNRGEHSTIGCGARRRPRARCSRASPAARKLVDQFLHRRGAARVSCNRRAVPRGHDSDQFALVRGIALRACDAWRDRRSIVFPARDLPRDPDEQPRSRTLRRAPSFLALTLPRPQRSTKRDRTFQGITPEGDQPTIEVLSPRHSGGSAAIKGLRICIQLNPSFVAAVPCPRTMRACRACRRAARGWGKDRASRARRGADRGSRACIRSRCRRASRLRRGTTLARRARARAR